MCQLLTEIFCSSDIRPDFQHLITLFEILQYIYGNILQTYIQK